MRQIAIQAAVRHRMAIRSVTKTRHMRGTVREVITLTGTLDAEDTYQGTTEVILDDDTRWPKTCTHSRPIRTPWALRYRYRAWSGSRSHQEDF